MKFFSPPRPRILGSGRPARPGRPRVWVGGQKKQQKGVSFFPIFRRVSEFQKKKSLFFSAYRPLWGPYCNGEKDLANSRGRPGHPKMHENHEKHTKISKTRLVFAVSGAPAGQNPTGWLQLSFPFNLSIRSTPTARVSAHFQKFCDFTCQILPSARPRPARARPAGPGMPQNA